MRRRVLLVKNRTSTSWNECVLPPLGIMYLAAVLRQKGHEVQLFDARLYDAWEAKEKLLALLRQFKPEVVGFSALTVEAPDLHEGARIVKAWDPRCLVVAGGPHIHAYPEDVTRDPFIDMGVMGEGEEALSQWLPLADEPRTRWDIAGLVFRDGERLVRRPPLPLRDLDAVPFPAWDLLELRAYARYPSMGLMSTRPYMAIITSRGCPYRCVYCHDVHGKRFRERSVENVLKEMEVLYGDYGIRDFRIVDDIFNFNLKRAKDILGGIVERGLDVELQFPNGIRADRADGELIEKMARAGTRQLSVAVETVSSLGQKRIRKFLKVEKVEETIHEAAARGIYTQGFFMLGLPGEGREEMQETIEFAARSKLHTALFFIATPYEGTEMADMVREKTAGISKGFEQYDSLVPSFNLSEVSHAELRALWRSAYRRFYASPQRLYRIVRDYPRKKELMAIWLSSLSRGIRRRLGCIRLLRTRGSRQSPLSLPALKQAPNPR